MPGPSSGFVQISGIRLVVDATKPAGERIMKLTSNASALDFAKTIRIATTEAVVKTLASLTSAKRAEGQSTAIAADVSAHLEAVGVRDIKALGPHQDGARGPPRGASPNPSSPDRSTPGCFRCGSNRHAARHLVGEVVVEEAAHGDIDGGILLLSICN